MKYSQLVDVYEDLSSTTKRLKKIDILSDFLKKLRKYDEEWIYLLRGKVLPDYDSREFGMSRQLLIKVISKASGETTDKIIRHYNKIGDLGVEATFGVGESLEAQYVLASLNGKYKMFSFGANGRINLSRHPIIPDSKDLGATFTVDFGRLEFKATYKITDNSFNPGHSRDSNLTLNLIVSGLK